MRTLLTPSTPGPFVDTLGPTRDDALTSSETECPPLPDVRNALALGSPPPVDVAQFAPTKKVLPTPLPEGQRDVAYDGALIGADGKAYPPSVGIEDIPAVQPRGGAKSPETLVLINGIHENKAKVAKLMHSLAEASHCPVVAVDNSTEGIAKDLLQCTEGQFHIGENPAVDTLTHLVYDKLKAGQPLHVVGYSQGAIITADALVNAENRLMVEDGLTRPQVQQRMHDLLRVETVAGGMHRMPDGPRYVHYVNHADPVAMSVGLGSHLLTHEGKGAQEQSFNGFSLSLNPLAGHNFNLYMKHYKPFDQVYGH